MQSHLIRRGAMYYYRRRIPADLLKHFNPKKELTKALGTSDRREAERLARALAVKHDDEFQAIRGAPSAAVAELSQVQQFSSPTNTKGQIPDADTQVLAVGDVQALAARVLARLRAQREQAIVDNTLELFLQKQRAAMEWDKCALEGKGDPDFPAWKHEAFIIARQHLLEPGRYPALAIPMVTQQAAPMQAIAPTGLGCESVCPHRIRETLSNILSADISTCAVAGPYPRRSTYRVTSEAVSLET